MKEREKIIDILQSVADGGYSTELLNENDSDFVRRSVYGVIEKKRFLDNVIESLSDRPLGDTAPRVRVIVEMSLYHLLCMDSLPDYAVVDEAVDLAPKKAKGYVNAVLREFIRRGKKTFEVTEDVKYSVSKEVYDLLGRDYSDSTRRKILAAWNGAPEFTIRVTNPAAAEELRNEGFRLQKIRGLEEGFIVENPKGIFDTALFREGCFTPQGGGSILTSKILDPEPESAVLDLCAAPGGKSAHLSLLMNNTGKIVANELHRSKNDRMRENFKRLGCENIRITNFDGEKAVPEWKGTFDYVLTDVPCTGLGEVNGKPEIKYRRTKGDVDDLVKIQKNIVSHAAEYLKPGGILVYSTCTLPKDENEGMRNYISDFLRPVPVYAFGSKSDFIKTMPYMKGYGGFFIAKFQKV